MNNENTLEICLAEFEARSRRNRLLDPDQYRSLQDLLGSPGIREPQIKRVVRLLESTAALAASSASTWA